MKAFPALRTEQYQDVDGNWRAKADDGMDLRDYFAAKAMQGLLTHEWLYLYDKAEMRSLESAEDYVVETSYFVADLMMKARNE
jgi:hypothetical protein